MRTVAYLIAGAAVVAGLYFALAGRTARTESRSIECEIGLQRDYELALSVSAKLGDTPLADGSFTGTYRLVATASRPAGCVFAAEISPTGGDRGLFGPTIAERHFVTVGDDGRVADLRIPRSVDPSAARMMKQLAASWQLVKPAAPASRWVTEEADVNGIFAATYRKTSDGATEKKKERYLKVSNAPSPKASIEVIDGKSRFLFDEGGLRELHSGDEIVVSTPGELISSARSRVEITLQRMKSERRDVRSLPQSGGLQPEALDSLRKQDIRASVDSQLATRQTLADVLGVLRSTSERDDEGRKARTSAFRNLSAMIRLNDRLVEQILELVRARDPDSRFFWDALASAGSPKAQEALVSLIHEEESVANRGAMLVSLSAVANPTEASMEALEDLRGDPVHGVQARYGLGNFADRWSDTKPRLAEQIVAQLQDDLQQASTPEQKKVALYALGNSASPDALDAIERERRAPQESVREAAVTALKDIRSERADSILAEALGDASPGVRAAAAVALRDRRPVPGTVTALGNAIRTETDLGSRMQMAKTAIDWLAIDRVLLSPVVAWLAENDPEPQIREAANRFR